MDYSSLSKKYIGEKLSKANGLPPDNPYPPQIINGTPRPAAILIPLLKEKNDWHLLFIRRTTHPHDPHSGQVAFPGGGKDKDDPDLKSAALRETFEETGIQPEKIELLGNLKDFYSISNYRVTPYIGVIPWPTSLVPDKEEVSRIFTIPLSWLSNPNNYQTIQKTVQPYSPFPVMYFDKYNGEILWGFTARVTLFFLSLLK